MERRVAVIGAGSVGTALAKGLADAGHRVAVGVRSPDDPKHAVLAASCRVAVPSDAVADADVVVLAVPVDSLAAVIPSLGLRSGQVVVDATNAVMRPVPGGFDTVGAYVASMVPEGVAVVKAFNTIGAEHLADGRLAGGPAFLPVAGDEAGRPVVLGLAGDLGFAPADLGDADAIAFVEAHARLWIHLAMRRGWGRDFGFVVARR